jgi:hypothetical protein
MGQAERPTCPGCGAFLILALPPGGKGQRTFQCLDCDGPDPLKTEKARGWLKGEHSPRSKSPLSTLLYISSERNPGSRVIYLDGAIA